MSTPLVSERQALSSRADAAVAAVEAAVAAAGSTRNVPYAGVPTTSVTLSESRQKKGEVARGASPPPWAESREMNTSPFGKRRVSPPRPERDNVGMAFLAGGLADESTNTRQFPGFRARIMPPKTDTSQLTQQELNREAPVESKRIFAKVPDENPILLGAEPQRERRGMPYFRQGDNDVRAAGFSPRRSPREVPDDLQEKLFNSGDAPAAIAHARATSREAPHRQSSNMTGVLDFSREASPPKNAIRDRPEQSPRPSHRSPRSLSRARAQSLYSGHAMQDVISGHSPQARLSAGSPERPRSPFGQDVELTTAIRETRRRSTPQPRSVNGLDAGLCQELADDFKDQLGIARRGRVSPTFDRQRHLGEAPWDHDVKTRRGKMSLSPPRQAALTDVRSSVRAPFATDVQAEGSRPPSQSLRVPRDRELLDMPRRARSPSLKESALPDRIQPWGTEADVPFLSPRQQRQDDVVKKLDVVAKSLFRDKETSAMADMRKDGAAALAGLEAAVSKVQGVNVEVGAVAQAAVQRARADLEEAMGTALRCLSPERAGPALAHRGSPQAAARQIEDSVADRNVESRRGSPSLSLRGAPRSTPPEVLMTQGVPWAGKPTRGSAPELPPTPLLSSQLPDSNAQSEFQTSIAVVGTSAAQDPNAGKSITSSRSSPGRQVSPSPPWGVDFPPPESSVSPEAGMRGKRLASKEKDVDLELLWATNRQGARRPSPMKLEALTAPSSRSAAMSPFKPRDISPTLPKNGPRAQSGSPTPHSVNSSPRRDQRWSAMVDNQTDKPWRAGMNRPLEIATTASSSKDRIKTEDPLQQAYTKQLNALQSEIGQLQARHHGLEVRMKRLRSDTKRVMDKDDVAVVPFAPASSSTKVAPVVSSVLNDRRVVDRGSAASQRFSIQRPRSPVANR